MKFASEKSSFLLTNTINKATAAACLLVGSLLSLLLHSKAIAIPALIEGSLFLLIIWLHQRKMQYTAAIFALVLHNLSVLYFGAIFGHAANAEMLGIFLCGLPFLTFEGKAVRYFFVSLSFVVTTTLLYIKINNLVPAIEVPDHLRNLVSEVSLITMMTLNTLMIGVFVNTNAINKRRAESFVKFQRHEVRNNLQIIKGIATKELGHQTLYFKDWKLVEGVADNTIDLVNNQLLYDRIIEGYEDDLKLEDFDLLTWASYNIDCRKAYASNKDITIELLFKSDVRYVRTDERKLTMILSNLLGNAIKYSPDHSRIEVEICHFDGAISIRVTDQGKGIPKENHVRIFDEFYSSNEKDSSGIGLTVCRNLVQKLGGNIFLKSELGNGSTFTVRVPLTVLNRLNHAEMPVDILLNVNILLIDDNEMTLMLVKKMLVDVGANVEVAMNATSGFEKIAQCRYDFIITDLQMPDVIGEDYIDRLTETASCAILILTGTEIDPKSPLYKYPHLLKPVKKENLVRKLLSLNILA